ncbi:MAG: hypothetical protein WCW66_06565 [Patescibacteria group bacterium]
MQLMIGLAVAFVALVSVLAIYPHLKFEQSYFSTWWIVARAVAVPYMFITIRIATRHISSLELKIVIAIQYYASVLVVGCWFLPKHYPLLETFTFMIIGLFPLIFFWGDPQTESTPTGAQNDTAVRDT